MINVVAVAALLLGVALLLAVVDLTREIRAVGERLRTIESWWYGNREMLHTLTFIFPELEKLADEAVTRKKVAAWQEEDARRDGTIATEEAAAWAERRRGLEMVHH